MPGRRDRESRDCRPIEPRRCVVWEPEPLSNDPLPECLLPLRCLGTRIILILVRMAWVQEVTQAVARVIDDARLTEIITREQGVTLRRDTYTPELPSLARIRIKIHRFHL